MKKVFLFGLLGALGCVLGWSAGEVVLKFGLPWAGTSFEASVPSIVTPPEPPKLGNQSTDQVALPPPIEPPVPPPFRAEPPPSPPPPSSDVAERLQREGAHQGDVEIALSWNNGNDIDLHVVDPSGEEIYYSHKTANSGGWLDVDKQCNNVSPVEHVFFPTGRAPFGHYKVYVAHYRKCDYDPTSYRVDVKANGTWQTYQGQINNNGSNAGKIFDSSGAPITQGTWQPITEFDISAPPPQLRLSAPDEVAVGQGNTNEFHVRIARGFFTEPVTVRLQESDNGLTIDETVIQAGDSEATLTLRADSGVPVGSHVVSLAASAETSRGHVQQAASLRVNVIKPPEPEPVLKISVPDTIEVSQTGRNQFRTLIGRYFFTAPLPVVLQIDSDTTDITANSQQIAPDAKEGLIEINASRTASPGKHRIGIVATSGSYRASGAITVDVVELPPTEPAWRMILVVAVWTALLAIGLSLLLALGQNRYLERPLLSEPGKVLRTMGGCAVAGAFAGAAGQALLAILPNIHAAIGGAAALPPVLGQAAGWFVLGAFLGRGIAFSVPNLPTLRASSAGAIGGLVGSGAFVTVTNLYGEVAGRIVGAVILGFAIGSMVAIAEAISRQIWLDLQYGAKEIRTVNLGVEPVSIGSDPGTSTIFAPNAPALAFIYKIAQGRILCTEGSGGKTFAVLPGDRRQAGKVTITVRTAEHPTHKSVAEEPFLVLSNGQNIPLKRGLMLSSRELPGLAAGSGESAVAQVTSHPQDPSILGLKNLSTRSWDAEPAAGQRRQVPPGKTVRVASGTKIDFGKVHGEFSGIG